MDVKNIAVGPNPPAFITPNVLKVLQDTWGLKTIGTDGKADVEKVFAAV